MKKQMAKILTKQDIERRLEEIKDALSICYDELEDVQLKIDSLNDEFNNLLETLEELKG